MIKLKSITLISVAVLITSSCVSYKPYEKEVANLSEVNELDHTIVFYSGSDRNNTTSFNGLKAVERQLTNANTLIVLGNIVSDRGLIDSTASKKRSIEEKLLTPDIDLINGFDGETFVVPGLNEWSGGRAYGYDRLLAFQS
ncbi:MAG: hypothetical protein AAF551_13535, partial [Bacteroidota bacterium]